jgi:hypothetical protein
MDTNKNSEGTPFPSTQPPENSESTNSVQVAAESLAQKIFNFLQAASQPHNFQLDGLEFEEEVSFKTNAGTTNKHIRLSNGEVIVSRVLFDSVDAPDESAVVSQLASALRSSLGDDLVDVEAKHFLIFVKRLFIRNTAETTSGTNASANVMGDLKVSSCK